MEEMRTTKIFVVTLDEPNENWLCADNMAVALNEGAPGGRPYCVSEITEQVQELSVALSTCANKLAGALKEHTDEAKKVYG